MHNRSIGWVGGGTCQQPGGHGTAARLAPVVSEKVGEDHQAEVEPARQKFSEEKVDESDHWDICSAAQGPALIGEITNIAISH